MWKPPLTLFLLLSGRKRKPRFNAIELRPSLVLKYAKQYMLTLTTAYIIYPPEKCFISTRPASLYFKIFKLERNWNIKCARKQGSLTFDLKLSSQFSYISLNVLWFIANSVELLLLKELPKAQLSTIINTFSSVAWIHSKETFGFDWRRQKNFNNHCFGDYFINVVLLWAMTSDPLEKCLLGLSHFEKPGIAVQEKNHKQAFS